MNRGPAKLILNHWGFPLGYSVNVFGETPQKYRVEAMENVPLPKRLLLWGDTALVPKVAVIFPTEASDGYLVDELSELASNSTTSLPEPEPVQAKVNGDEGDRTPGLGIANAPFTVR